MTHAEIRAGLTDANALVATLYGEARGERIESIIACACVVRNRARAPRWWGDSFRSVCLKKWQFSCWWEEDSPNTSATYDVADGLIRRQPLGIETLLSELAWVAHGVIEGQLRDVTKGSDHYLTRALYQSDRSPSWARDVTPVAEIGAHVFLRLEV